MAEKSISLKAVTSTCTKHINIEIPIELYYAMKAEKEKLKKSRWEDYFRATLADPTGIIDFVFLSVNGQPPTQALPVTCGNCGRENTVAIEKAVFQFGDYLYKYDPKETELEPISIVKSRIPMINARLEQEDKRDA